MNEVGESRPSLGSVIVKTLEELPSSPPLEIRAANTSATSILVKWKPPPPTSVNGELKGNMVVEGCLVYQCRFDSTWHDLNGFFKCAAMRIFLDHVRPSVRPQLFSIGMRLFFFLSECGCFLG